jgi:hypothetical protein
VAGWKGLLKAEDTKAAYIAAVEAACKNADEEGELAPNLGKYISAIEIVAGATELFYKTETVLAKAAIGDHYKTRQKVRP